MENVTFEAPHQFVGEAWRRFQLENPGSSVSINGRIFEYLVAECLAQMGVTPFYFQASMWLVSNSDFDVVLYDRKSPVVLSMKTSLRERYKQADLEGRQLKWVYSRAKVYLITLSEGEIPRVKQKIADGDVNGLDDCILASSQEFSDLIEELASRQFSLAEPIEPIERGQVVTTQQQAV